MGHDGKGLFWDIIEIMYEQGGYITAQELKSIAYALHTECERITKVLTEFDLFKNDGEKYWSESVIRRLKIRESKSEKASLSAKKRWEKAALDANALQTQSEGNANKEKKRRVKKSKEEKKELILPFSSDAFVSAWNDLLEQPKWRKKTDRAYQICLEQLAGKSEKVAIEMIKKAIANNYQGLFNLNAQEIAEAERKPLYVSQIKNDDY